MIALYDDECDADGELIFQPPGLDKPVD
jgi:hypothetical protein